MGDDDTLNNSYALRSDEDTKAHYAAWADTYDDELTGKEYAQPVRCAAALALLVPDTSASILDVGCGTGLSGVALRDVGYTTINGCDFAPEMLAKANELDLYGRLFEANLNESLEVATNSYDAIAAVGVFSFGHIRAEAIDELCRVVRPGGAVVIGTNAKFHDEGTVPNKLKELEAAGTISALVMEHGDHIPGFDMTGWVMRALVT